MRKISLTVAFVAAMVCISSAQSFKLGVKGGLNFPSASSFSLDQGNDKATGYHAGLFASIKVSKIAVQPEVLYSFSKFTDVNDVEVDFNYLTIPVMAKIYLLQGLNVQVGPQFGVLLSSETKAGNITIDNTEDALKASDISLGLGAGFDTPFGLDIHARYNIGLTDNSDIDGAADLKTNTFQVSLGYALFKKG